MERKIIIKKFTKLSLIKFVIIVFIAFFVAYAILISGNYKTNSFPTSSTIFVNGEDVSFVTYNINGFRYFKLSDLAYSLSGTTKQFDISWDNDNNDILLISGNPYTIVNSEVANVTEEHKVATPSTSRFYLGDSEVQLVAYNIEDSIYIMLRDIAEVIDFFVNWDHDRIIIDTSKPFVDSTIAFKLRPLVFDTISYPDRINWKADAPWSDAPWSVITSHSEYERYLKNLNPSDSVLEMYTDDFFINNYLVIIPGGGVYCCQSLTMDGELVIGIPDQLSLWELFFLKAELNNTFLPAEFNVSFITCW